MKSRTDILNFLIKNNNYKTYLEIGVRNPNDNFNKIKIDHKDGVDPNANCNYPITSDHFFEKNNTHYDLIFIDGLHLEDQVKKDIENSIKYLNENGTIIVHDCNPIEKEHQKEEYTGGTWNGTTWKGFVHFRLHNPELKMAVIDLDHGCGIIKKGTQTLFTPSPKELDWEFLVKHRESLLNLISVSEFKKQFAKKSFIKQLFTS